MEIEEITLVKTEEIIVAKIEKIIAIAVKIGEITLVMTEEMFLVIAIPVHGIIGAVGINGVVG
ncbi:hypothetical protein [Metaclostridioides mangenotii]|uniref:hypothetical protein n=1 Tax=Metaclostridioides mangenotii TaxID=1540 RepID=UPI0028F1333C|nr:hypothetical protein [Clostridioides mangenotii]